jgi:hypothetical protein
MRLQEDLIENNHELQARLETVETRTERENIPAACSSTAPPLTFNGSTSWSVFRWQFEIAAEHNRWSNRENSTYTNYSLQGPGGRRATQNPDKYELREYTSGTIGPIRCPTLCPCLQLPTNEDPEGRRILARLPRPLICCPTCLHNSSRWPHGERSRVSFRIQCTRPRHTNSNAARRRKDSKRGPPTSTRPAGCIGSHQIIHK